MTWQFLLNIGLSKLILIKFYNIALDDAPNRILDEEWEFSQTIGREDTYGNPDPNSGQTGSYVYGVDLNEDYNTSVGGPNCVTAVPFDCSYYYNVRLSFAGWLNTNEAARYATREVI